MKSRGLRGLRVIRQLFFVGAYLPSKPNVHKRFFIFLSSLYMESAVVCLEQGEKISFAHTTNTTLNLFQLHVFCGEFQGFEGNQTAIF